MARVTGEIWQLAHHLYPDETAGRRTGCWPRCSNTLQREQIVRIKLEAMSMDSTIVKSIPTGRVR